MSLRQALPIATIVLLFATASPHMVGAQGGMNMRNVTLDASRRAQQAKSLENLDEVARAAETRINASRAENIALRRAANADEMRKILVRNGFTSQQLRGVNATKPIDETVYAEGDAVGPIKIVRECCPAKLVISW